MKDFLADKQRLACLERSVTHTLLGGAGKARRRLQLHYATLCADWVRAINSSHDDDDDDDDELTTTMMMMTTMTTMTTMTMSSR